MFGHRTEVQWCNSVEGRTKNNFSINRKGKKKSDDTKNNMSEVKKGSNNPKSKLTETDVLNIRNNNTFKKEEHGNTFKN